jgi:tetratricopeptide (TPR) repeat protein
LSNARRNRLKGFTWTLAGRKAYLEHNIRSNLVADRFPNGPEDPYPDGTNDRNAIRGQINLASLYQDEAKFDEAEKVGNRVLAAIETKYASDQAGIAAAAQNLAVLYRTEARNDEAEALYRRSLALVRQFAGEKNPAYANVLQNLSVVMREEKKYDEAESLGKQSLEIWTQNAR